MIPTSDEDTARKENSRRVILHEFKLKKKKQKTLATEFSNILKRVIE